MPKQNSRMTGSHQNANGCGNANTRPAIASMTNSAVTANTALRRVSISASANTA